MTQEHKHSAFTRVFCEEHHNGILTIFDECPLHCAKHECLGKIWIEEESMMPPKGGKNGRKRTK